jgi:molybdopterin synthase catalytic subunit
VVDEVIRLLAVSDEPLDVAEVLAAVRHPQAGGTAVFVGTVRDHDGGRSVQGLGYEAHPTVLEALQAVAENVAKTHGVLALAAVHRVGDLEIGDDAVIVAASCAHRQEAFDAAKALIDDLKRDAPIWKHQRFVDGTEEWVGSP